MAILENIASPSRFLEIFLNKTATSIPKGAQWVVLFHDLRTILPAIKLAYEGEPGGRWKTDQAAETLLSEQYQTMAGCLFCQAISIPGEGMTPVPEGIKANGFIRSYVGAGRNDFPIMRMTFLETNLSFTDSFLRGWSLATSKFGMIARASDSAQNYRTDLTCYKLSISPEGPYISQTLVFDKICCVGVSEEEFNYDHKTAAMKREAQFVYNSYKIDTDTNIDPNMFRNQPIFSR